jgi:hypothetical protein
MVPTTPVGWVAPPQTIRRRVVAPSLLCLLAPRARLFSPGRRVVHASSCRHLEAYPSRRSATSEELPILGCGAPYIGSESRATWLQQRRRWLLVCSLMYLASSTVSGVDATHHASYTCKDTGEAPPNAVAA